MKVEVLSGENTIGGNFIRLGEKDRAIVFDQGIRFDVMGRYYRGPIAPGGIAELRELGAIPKPEWYEGVDAIYVSHLHLDHLGALSNIPDENTVYLPSLAVYQDMEERWSRSPSWLSLVPRKYYVGLEELSPFKADRNDVMALPVSHSAYPSYALLYFGRKETVLYTGDFRVEGFFSKQEFHDFHRGGDLLEFLGENRDIRVDTLIIEGTNLGSGRTPLGPAEATEMLRKIMSSHKAIIATMHGLDLEYAYTLMKIAAKLKLECYVASTQTAKLIEKIPKLPLEPKAIQKYVEQLTTLEKVALEDVEQESIFLVSYWEIVDFIRDIMAENKLVKGTAAIISEPEPQVEEGTNYDVVANWFSKVAVEPYRIRVSGHYYPYQVKNILKTIKPKKIKVIHTENPEFFKNYTNKAD